MSDAQPLGCLDDRNVIPPQDLIDYLPLPIFLKDCSSVFLYCNRRFAETEGLSPVQIVGSDDYAVTSYELAEKFRREDRNVIETGKTGIYIGEYEKPSGRRVFRTVKQPYRDSDGRIVGVFGYVEDITDQYKSELSVQAQAKRFEALLASTMDGYLHVDIRGKILDVNDSACQMLRYSREELLRMTLSDFDVEEKPEETRAHIRKLMSAGYDRFETRHRRKDGVIIDVEVSTTYRTIDEQEFVIAFVHDITDRKAVADAERAREVAERANEAKSRFLNNVTHELRTPLNSILGFAQLLELDAALSEEQRDFVREIRQGGERLAQLVEGVLELSRIESNSLVPTLEPISCRAIVEESILDVADKANRQGIAVTLECDDGAVMYGDRLMVRRVLTQLLSNAIKFNRPGGTIYVRSYIEERNIHIEVEDSGIGIARSAHKNVFAPFNRLGHEGGSIPGVGTGLVIARRLVEIMGGEMSFHSTAGRGSVFWFRLPRG